MKKVLFACLLFAGTSSFAQTFTGGLKAGANITNFIGAKDVDDAKYKSLVGFHAGAWFNIGLGLASIQPEVLVSTAGTKYEHLGEKETINLTYITVPVMVRFKSESGFYLEAGPQVGFKIGEDFNEDESIKNFAKDLDLSVGAGLGFQGKGGFGIGARYLLGVSKVGDFESSALRDPDFQNSVIQIGISFKLSK